MANSEFTVLEGSPLIGKTIGSVEKKYEVRVRHCHNPNYGIEHKSEARPDKKIQKRLIIQVEGSWDNVARISKDSV